MSKYLIAILFLFFYLNSSAQNDDLDAFVNNQQAKLIYDSSKLVKVPNLDVYLIPPDYFEKDSSINGFYHAGSASTIQVIEIKNVSFRVIESSMTEAHIANQNYKLLKKKSLTTVTGKSGIIYYLSFISNNVEYERAMFFTGEKNTIWVNINYPTTMKKLLLPAFEACLQSVQQ